MRISPQQYFQENLQNETNIHYYPILIAVLIGGLIAITVIAILKK